MKHNICNFVGLLTITTLMFGATSGFAAVPSNPRGASVDATARARGGVDAGTKQRSADRVVLRNVTVRGDAPERVTARGTTTNNTVRGVANVARNGTPAANVSRSAGVARVANNSVNTNRSAVTNGASRSALSRATAVFNDVSKIGGGYAACRDAYATCMDQFCANANDTYRRCFCSSRFTEFRDTEEALDRAKTLLMQFEDNNLNAVDKSAAEVDAMYSATVGEAAIKSDTSGAAKILDEIGDLLSGKKAKNNNASLGLITIDTLTGEIDDIWGDNGGSSVFATSGSAQSLSEMEGEVLYNASNNQCVGMIADNCQSDAVLQMARSSYSIMITQDCNAYEKKIDKQREAVKQTVRTAEKYLREARLDEYRSHNSADVNECIAKVKDAILADTACGDGYKRCLDYTGKYINATTGDPIYSINLHNLTTLIQLPDNSADVLKGANTQFDKFLDGYRVYATRALETCRDKADTVWTEFKRSALIEIAQAQDEKLESVKMSCVSTMKDCYDTIGGQIKEFDDTTAKAAGATGAYAARAMCQEKVAACASLYGGNVTCQFDNDGKITNASACGLGALFNFVDSVDDTRVAEACDTAVDNYLSELCTPSSGTYKYPYSCRSLVLGDKTDDFDKVLANENPKTAGSIWAQLGRFVYTNCTASKDANGKATIDTTVENKIITKINNLKVDMANILSSVCETVYGGIWTEANSSTVAEQQSIAHGDVIYAQKFYNTVYGGNMPNPDNGSTTAGSNWGLCIENSVQRQCEAQDVLTGNHGYAKFNADKNICEFDDAWYEYKCNALNGYWENDTCYLY